MLGERALPPGGARQHHVGDEGQQTSTETQQRRVAAVRRAVDVQVNLLNIQHVAAITHRLLAACSRPGVPTSTPPPSRAICEILTNQMGKF